MRLHHYLNKLSWSQADLAREAGISTQSVSRALKGDRISRRVGSSIAEALTRAMGKRVTIGDLQGFQLAPLRRKRKGEAPGGQGNTSRPKDARPGPGEPKK